MGQVALYGGMEKAFDTLTVFRTLNPLLHHSHISHALAPCSMPLFPHNLLQYLQRFLIYVAGGFLIRLKVKYDNTQINICSLVIGIGNHGQDINFVKMLYFFSDTILRNSSILFWVSIRAFLFPSRLPPIMYPSFKVCPALS